MAVLDRVNSEPLYTQLENLLRTEITSGVRKPGERLESLRELARKYRVSLFTVQRTIAALSRDGLLRAEKGRGTFVASSQPITKPDGPGNAVAFLSTYPVSVLQDTAFFSRLLQGLYRFAVEGGKDLLCLAPKDHRRAPVPGMEVRGRDVCGVVVLSYETNYLLALRDLGMPIVTADMDLHFAGLDGVIFDNRQAGYEVGRMLAREGKRRICYVARSVLQKDGSYRDQGDPAIWERLAGLKRAFAEFGCPEFDGQIQHMDANLEEETGAVVERILALDPGPDAVVAYDDVMALRLAEQLERGGLAVPREVRMAGFGNTVSTADTSRYEMVRAVGDENAMADACVRLLFRRLEKADAPAECESIPMIVEAP